MTLKINPEDWNRLSAEDQSRTEDVIKSFFKGQTIDIDSNAPLLSLPAEENIMDDLCKAACQAAQVAAVIACSGEPICTTLAIAAGEACKKAC